MILINREVSVEVKISFSKIVKQVNTIIKTKKSQSNIDKELELLNSLDKKTIRKLVFSKPKRLRNIVLKLYNKHPELCEFYSPDYFFRNLNLSSATNLQLPLNDKENKRIVYQELSTVIQSIRSLPHVNSSVILNDILSTPYSLTKLSVLRDKILDLLNIKKKGTLNNNTIALFPSWISSISQIFNYSLINRETAYQLNRFLEIYACPYCNSEEIEAIYDETGHDYRPAFDHFIPKYKYPFISFSIYNLIPSCTKCNSTYKKTLDPIMTSLSNPFLEGVNDSRLFSFDYDINYIYSSGIIENENITIKLKKLGNSIDNNMEEFSIAERYNSHNIKRIARVIAKRAFDLKSFEENFNMNPSVLLTFGYDSNVEPLKHTHKKLMQDAILTFSNKHVPLN
ncbi:hypothetical protein LVR30_17055 [Pantoea ananatis]|uniref:hypothetical protein n=1 Tax=Pantoea ananas TaxID=553 RepID=UPI002025DB62|nr:hypothetical protein [Pantoea ananatis]URL13912.1 hypothetical protein LVR30_17055 [Pantoea ananatis]